MPGKKGYGKTVSIKSLRKAGGSNKPMNGVRVATTGRPKLNPTNGMSKLGKPAMGGKPKDGARR